MTRVTIMTAALLVGCSAGTEPAAAPAANVPPTTDVTALAAGAGSKNFTIRVPGGGSDLDVLVGDRSITGPGFTLTRYNDASDHAMRGDAFKQKVNVDVTADGAQGICGGGPFDVKVALVGDELQVHGTVSGKPAIFAISPRALNGNVGRCSFEMVRKGLEYVGSRGCGRGRSGASVTFPASFGQWSLPELGSALAILLGSGS
jgi:hypothetical protein